MECSMKHGWNEISVEKLNNLKVDIPDEQIYLAVKDRFDRVAKPLDGLGKFEEITARIAGAQGKTEVSISRRALVIMSADNGIVEEGVSQSTSEVTLKVVKNILKGKSSAAVMAKNTGTDVYVTDVGINTSENIEGLDDKKIRKGSRNFLKEKAMTPEETLDAIRIGILKAEELSKKGYEAIALGEMGIGNTTTSSAVCAALLKLEAKSVTGRGAGLSDEGLKKKINVIDQALKKYDLYNADSIEILSCVGGYDLAALTGVCIGAAVYGIPVILDGMITQTAALAACRIVPGVREYIFASHVGKEAASRLLLEEMNLKPVMDADIALGEGVGALMLFSLLDNVICVLNNAAKFDELEMDEYERL